MNDEQKPFMEYWEDVDEALVEFFGIDTSDAGIEPDEIAGAQEEGQTPKDVARWYGEKYGLTYLGDRKALYAPPSPKARGSSS